MILMGVGVSYQRGAPVGSRRLALRASDSSNIHASTFVGVLNQTTTSNFIGILKLNTISSAKVSRKTDVFDVHPVHASDTSRLLTFETSQRRSLATTPDWSKV